MLHVLHNSFSTPSPSIYPHQVMNDTTDVNMDISE